MQKSYFIFNTLKSRQIKRSNIVAVVLLFTVLYMVFSVSCNSTPTEQLPTIKEWERPKISTENIASVTSEPDADGVQFINVGMAEDGNMIIVNFRGPAQLIDKWNQGSVYLVDEVTGNAFDQIPVAPVIGPLFGKPKKDGGLGYALLNNIGKSIRPGLLVTVVLGNYKREHVIVNQ
jgi:hypothetical protein